MIASIRLRSFADQPRHAPSGPSRIITRITAAAELAHLLHGVEEVSKSKDFDESFCIFWPVPRRNLLGAPIAIAYRPPEMCEASWSG
jgi:hypothetical protein